MRKIRSHSIGTSICSRAHLRTSTSIHTRTSTSTSRSIKARLFFSVNLLIDRLRDDKGQMLAELVIVIPVLLLALAIVVNMGMFFAEAARFDRIAAEVARTMATYPTDPAGATEAVLYSSLDYPGGEKRPFLAKVKVQSSNEAFLSKRILYFTFEYEMIMLGFLPHKMRTISRSKTLTIYWSTGL